MALSLIEIETFLAQTAGVIFPLQTVLEVTFAFHKLIVFSTGAAILVLVFLTSVNHTGTALELVVREALHTDSTVMFETTLLHLLAGTIFCQVVPAFAGNTSKVIVTLALLDCALIVLEEEGLMAFGTGVVSLFHLAAEKIVMLALPEDERVLGNTLLAGVIRVVTITVLHSQQAGA